MRTLRWCLCRCTVPSGSVSVLVATGCENQRLPTLSLGNGGVLEGGTR